MKKISEKQKLKNKEKAKVTEAMHLLFKRIWDKNEDEMGQCYCTETGRALYAPHYRHNSCCYHHLLPKSKYPELALDERNIVILHPNVHAQVENDLDKCPKVRALTIKMKEIYDSSIKNRVLE